LHRARRDAAAPDLPPRADVVDEEPRLADLGRRLVARRLERRLELSLEVPGELAVELRDERERRLGVLLRAWLHELGEAFLVGHAEIAREELGVVGGVLEAELGERRPVARPRLADDDVAHPQ